MDRSSQSELHSSQRASTAQNRSARVGAALALGVIVVGGVAVAAGSASLTPSGPASTTIGTEVVAPDPSLLVDERLPDLDGVPAPAGKVPVGDKSGVVRGFVTDGWEPYAKLRVANGEVLQGRVVSGLDGATTGYFVPGPGFIPISVASDAVKIDAFLRQWRTFVDALPPPPLPRR